MAVIRAVSCLQSRRAGCRYSFFVFIVFGEPEGLDLMLFRRDAGLDELP
jgi:hypothetical protein